MNVAALPPLRVAFVGADRDALHLPVSCSWADARVFTARDGAWAGALEEAREFGPDACVALRARGVPGEALARVPGLKIEVGPPLPVDVSRCLSAPDLEATEVAVPEWARPPPAVLERLEATVRVRTIRADAPPTSWPDLLAGVSTAVCWTSGSLGVDAFPLVALANGVLLASNAAFPAPWGIEPEDEYLHAPGEDHLAGAVLEAVGIPESVRAVRVRAWQKVREAFSAESVYRRLVHDALLFDEVRREPAVRGAPR